MTETTARRTYLIAVLRHLDETATTKLALQIYADSPWRTTSRNTARRDLRDLARRAHLVSKEVDGARAYSLGAQVRPMHPMRGSREELRQLILREGGEWTVGRVKRAWRRILGTHVLRMAARRYLANLHRDGYLDRHDDGTSRRFYTLATAGKGDAGAIEPQCPEALYYRETDVLRRCVQKVPHDWHETEGGMQWRLPTQEQEDDTA